MLYNFNKRSFFFLTFIIVLLIFSPSKTFAKKSENFLGDNNAKITIIEYASMTCDHCANFHKNIFPEIYEKYIQTGKVKFIFRDFPLDKQALFAAILANCAPKEKYFDFVKLIFNTTEKWISVEDEFLKKLKNIGKMGGLSNDQIESCFRDENMVDLAINSRSNGEKKFNITSTPSFIINGKKYSSMTFEQFEKVLDNLIN
jgi:protein-disulfide isomerase